ncbi:MAG TPA: hypothetical protein VG187_16515 [Mycobacterium sp.]|nr:hypothetical protein [Mycobacterium sp.]
MADSSSRRAELLRSPAGRIVIAAALTAELVLGVAFLAVGRLHSSAADALEHPSRAATDEQTKAEVVDQARFIVAVAALQNATAGYLLMSCKDRDDPPYQGAVYLNFALPADARADEYFRNIAAAMVARGWTKRLPPNRALVGKTFSKAGVTAILYQDSDSEKHGVARIYGQCNNMNNHRGDSTAWIDITDQLH